MEKCLGCSFLTGHRLQDGVKTHQQAGRRLRLTILTRLLRFDTVNARTHISLLNK